MAGKQNPASIMSLVQEAVFRLGPCTNLRILAEVGSHISQIVATQYAKAEINIRREHGCRPIRVRYTVAQLVAMGRRRMVNNTLTNLKFRGKIRRVSKGVYAPPQPKRRGSE